MPRLLLAPPVAPPPATAGPPSGHCRPTLRLIPLTPAAQAEDKEALLRKEARDARLKAAELSDKARGLRALAQKGVNNVLEAALPPPATAP